VSVITQEIPHSNKITQNYIGTVDYETEKQVFRSIPENCFNLFEKKSGLQLQLKQIGFYYEEGCKCI
jgi:hypothetical protein